MAVAVPTSLRTTQRSRGQLGADKTASFDATVGERRGFPFRTRLVKDGGYSRRSQVFFEWTARLIEWHRTDCNVGTGVRCR